MTTPTPREALDRVLKAGRRSLHTAFPAKVLAYDPVAQTVDVEPQLMRELEDDEGALDYERLPVLYDVPIQWARAGGFVITFPIASGDFVEVQCAEQSTLAWRESGAVSVPGVSQPHGLNGCIARPGWYPDTQRLGNVSTTDLVIGTVDGATTIRIKPDGSLHLGSDAGNDFVALAAKVDEALDAIAKAFSTFVPGSGGANFPQPYTRSMGATVRATKVRAR